MLYLFQVTVYSALLYTVYLLVLKNRASHTWNRYYLLLCATLPLVIPFIKIAGITTTIPVAANKHILPTITVSAQNKPHNVFLWDNIILLVYIIIALAILLRTIIQYIRFRRFVRANSYEMVNGTKVLLNTNMGPGSFQQYIFLPGSEIDDAIMQHEMAHIKLKHSNDILLLRLLQAIFWPNIVLHTITAELKIVHEFQADAYAVQNKDAYISTLLNDTFSTNNFSLSHTFFYHPLKRRIMMLQRSPLSRAKMRMAILQTGTMAILLLAGMVYLQSCRRQVNDPLNLTKAVIDTSAAQFPLGHLPSYTGDAYWSVDMISASYFDFYKYIYTHIKYPESARKKGIEGTVYVNFHVDVNGIAHDMTTVGPDESLCNEAKRVISAIPKWTRGRNEDYTDTYIEVPVAFKLD